MTELSKYKNMQIKFRKSKLWELVKIFFPDADLKRAWITFGRTIWSPGTFEQDVIQHELVHVGQQRNWKRAIIWWIKYIRDKKFRYSQELPAYQAQFDFLKTRYKDRNVQSRIKLDIAGIMSGKMYNGMVGIDQALRDLK